MIHILSPELPPDTAWGHISDFIIFFNHPSYFSCQKASSYPLGDLAVDGEGIACSGLIVRHLVMPENLDGTYHILKYLKEKVSIHAHVNLMSQYHPMGEADNIRSLSTPLTPEEFRRARQMAQQFNLEIN